jgi:hypothetical protein
LVAGEVGEAVGAAGAADLVAGEVGEAVGAAGAAELAVGEAEVGAAEPVAGEAEAGAAELVEEDQLLVLEGEAVEQDEAAVGGRKLE